MNNCIENEYKISIMKKEFCMHGFSLISLDSVLQF